MAAARLAIGLLALLGLHLATAAPASRITVQQRVGDGLQPSIGNGFLSGDVGCCWDPASSGCQQSSCGALHIAGVFNVRPVPGAPVSWRADIGNPLAAFVDPSATTAWQGATLDLATAALYNLTQVSTCPGATIQLTHLAHRAHRQLLLLEVRALGLAPGAR
jgi:hypothetical protein